MQFSEFDNAETQKLQVFQEIDIRSIFNIFKKQKINLSLFVAIFTIQKFRNDPLRGFRRNNAVFRIFTMHIPVFLGRFSLSNFYNFLNRSQHSFISMRENMRAENSFSLLCRKLQVFLTGDIYGECCWSTLG